MVAAIAGLAAAGCGGSAAHHERLIATVAGVSDGGIPQVQFQHRLDTQLKIARARRADAPDPPTFRRCIAGTRHELNHVKLPSGAKLPKLSTKRIRASCRAQYAGMRKDALTVLIETVWIEHEAAQRGIHLSSGDIARQTANEKQVLGIGNLDQYLKLSGMTRDDFDRQVRSHALAIKIGQQLTAHLPQPTAAQIASYRAHHRQQFLGPQTRDVAMVVTSTPAAAQQALSRLRHGETFASVAKALSTDPTTRSHGGRLPGYVLGSSPDRVFDASVGNAGLGLLLGPVQTQHGYVVFRVTRIRPGSLLPPTQALTKARQLVLDAERQRILRGLMERLHAKWKPRTTCLTALRVPDCRGVRERPAP